MKFFFAVLTLSLNCQLAYSQAPSLTLEEALQTVYASHPEIIKATERVRQYSYYTTEAKRRFFPSLEVSANFDKNNYFSDPTQSYSVGFSQEVWDGGYGPTVRQNVRRQMAEENRARSIKQTIALETINSYLDLVKAQAALAAQKSQFEVVSKVYADAAFAYKMGLVGKQTFFEAEAEYLKGQYLVTSAEGGAQTACYTLLSILGSQNPEICANPAPVTKPEITMPSSPGDAIKAALENRPEIWIDANLLEAAKAGQKLARSEFFPKVLVSASYGYSNSPFRGGFGSFPQDGTMPGLELEQDWSAGVAIKIPLFDFGKKKQKLKAAEAAVAQAEQDKQTTIRKISADVQSRLVAVNTALSSYASAESGQKSALNSLETSLAAYKLGSLSLTNLMLRVAEKAAADVRLTEAMANVTQSLYSLQVALGSDIEAK